MKKGLFFPLLALLITAGCGSTKPDVIFVATPDEVIEGMLDLAQVTQDDVVYDLGCGDGRIVIAAAKRGARGVGIDIDAELIRQANERAQAESVTDRTRFITGDLFKTDISEASVVTLYLLSRLNVKLRPKLLKELKPGTRIISHGFDMGDWKPEKELIAGGHPIYLWTVPGRD